MPALDPRRPTGRRLERRRQLDPWHQHPPATCIAADFEAIDDPAPTGLNVPISGTTAITSNVWHHAAATFDGTTWAVYLNGNLEASTNPGLHPRSDSIQHAALGAMLPSGARPTPVGKFQGVLDEARVWNRRPYGSADPRIQGPGTDLRLRPRRALGLERDRRGTDVPDSIAAAANGTITGTGFDLGRRLRPARSSRSGGGRRQLQHAPGHGPGAGRPGRARQRH